MMAIGWEQEGCDKVASLGLEEVEGLKGQAVRGSRIDQQWFRC